MEKLTVKELKEFGFPNNLWYELNYRDWGDHPSFEFSGIPFSDEEWNLTFYELMKFIPSDYTEEILLRLRDYLPFNEIAAKTGISTSRIIQRYEKAMHMLRRNSKAKKLYSEGYYIAMPMIGQEQVWCRRNLGRVLVDRVVREETMNCCAQEQPIQSAVEFSGFSIDKATRVKIVASGMSTGQRLKAFRKALGLSAVELRVIMQVEPGVISRYETGKTRPTVSTLKKFANVFNIPVCELVDSTYLGSKEFTRSEYVEMVATAAKSLNIEGILEAVKLINELSKLHQYKL